MRIWGLALALVLMGTACPANHHYKIAAQHELAGREYQAAREYLEALSRRPSWVDAQVGLANVAQIGFERRLRAAEELEDARKYRDAAAVYDELDRFVAQLRRFNADTFATPDLVGRAAAMRDAAVAMEFEQGEQALARRDWGAAFDHFNKVKQERPRYPGVDLGIAKAWYGSGLDREAEGAWRDAAGAFLSAVDALGAPHADAVARAASIYEALGDYHVAQGACRQGWRDLVTASKLLPPGELQAKVDNAWVCAEQVVVIHPLQSKFPGGVSGMDATALLYQRTLEKVRTGASEFFTLRDALNNDVDFVVDGDLVEAWAETREQRRDRVVTGVERYACDVVGADGVTSTSTCEDGVDVRYTEVNFDGQAQVQGSARVVHRVSRVQRAVRLGAGQTAPVHFVTDFKSVAGVPVAVQASGDRGVILPQDIVDLGLADSARPDERVLFSAALDEVAAQLADHILVTVDTEPQWQDPVQLKLKR